MADEEFGDLNLTQYGVGGGRWLQSSNPSWMRYSHDGQKSNVTDRYSSQKSGIYESESAASLCTRTPNSGQARGRSAHYYSPPGTSYTIVERPVAASSIDQQYETSSTQKYTTAYHQSHPSHSYSPRSASKNTGTKRPMSPEEVLKMFGSAANKGKSCARRSQSPASSPPSTTHRQYVYLNTHDDVTVRTVTMVRQPDSGHGFGICVKGGKDTDSSRPGVYISKVEEGSIAERVGLKPGDSILEVNGTPFSTVTHEEALKMLKSCRKLSMTVQSPNVYSQTLPAAAPNSVSVGGPWLVRQSYSWMDREGRPVSPPLEYARAAPPPVVNPRWVYTSRSKESGGTRKVDLNIEPGQSLGLMIRGGLEYNLGIFITGVDKDSVAERAGLMSPDQCITGLVRNFERSFKCGSQTWRGMAVKKSNTDCKRANISFKVGDQILEVNGQSFLDVTHDEAVNQLKIHKRMSLLVRDVGKVPHSCTAYDDYLWQPCYSNSSADRTLSGKECCPAMQMVEEKARVLLSRNEMSNLLYYHEEYASRHMTVEAFVTVLLELLNSPEKHTLLTELRELILPEDRVRFDDLVYRRVPLETDRHLHRRKCCDNVTPTPNIHDFHHSHEYFGTFKPTKIPVLVEGLPLETEGYNTPSEDSGVCLGDGRTNERASWIAATSPVYRKQPSDLALSNGDCSSISQSGYLEGLKSQFDGWTQRVKSWYWGRPLELTHKLSRSFDMKEDQRHLESAGGNVRRHQSMQRLSRSEGNQEEEDLLMGPMVVQDPQGNLRVTVSKTKPILGIAIEGGANTRHPLPRIINIHENGAAYEAGGLEVGQLILEVDGQKVDGMHHQEIARLIAESFARKERHEIEFLVMEAKKSNTEPKPTALIFLEA